MANQAAANIQQNGLAALGTPTAVERVLDNGAAPIAPTAPGGTLPTQVPVVGAQPTVGAWPAADGGVSTTQHQPAMPNNYAARPASIEAQMQAQQEQADPQAIGNAINERRLEQIMADSSQRTQDLLTQVQAQNATMNQHLEQTATHQQQQAELARQQLEIDRANQAALQQQNTVSHEQAYALTPEEQAAFGESMPVIDKRAQMHANQIIDQRLANQPEDPRVAALQAQVDELNGKIGEFDTYKVETFNADVENAATRVGLNAHTLQSNPEWVRMMAETQQTVPGTVVGQPTTYGQMVQQALDAKTAFGAGQLQSVFQEFANRTQGQLNPGNTGAAIPTGAGQTRPSAEVQAPNQNMQAIESEVHELAAREASLRDAYRRGRKIDGVQVTTESFMTEMNAIDRRRGEITQKLQ